MRIVIFGLALSSSWGNGHATTYRSLIKGLWRNGHQVTFFERDVPWYADNRDADRFEFCELTFYRSLEELSAQHRPLLQSADAVIVGSYVPEAPELVAWLGDVVGGQLCFYDIDTPVTLEALERDECEYLAASLIPRFDVYFSFSGGPALDRLAELGARRPRPLFCCVDTEVYRPLETDPSGPRRWRLGYMGTYAADRQPAVDRLLLDVARARPDAAFVLAGPGYEDVARPANVEWLPHVGPADHRDFYAAQEFTLNTTRAAMVAIGHSPSVRLFEAAACGSCIVTDAWPGLEESFEPGREVLVADETDDVLAFLDELPAERRRAMGEAARQRVLAEHSHTRRAEYLVSCLQEPMEMQRVAT